MSTVPRYTTRDLEAFPDPLDDTRYEIIDGDLYVSKQPSWHHQRVCYRLGSVLDAWSEQTGLGLGNAAPGLIFSPEDNVAPDLIWTSRTRLEGRLDAAGHLHIAPELVIEVLSPGLVNAQRDREMKLKLYSRQGVLEYWSVDWLSRAVQIYRHSQGRLELAATLSGEDLLTSPLLPGFSCPLARIWSALA
jgi:Uma2 family endonuclease